MTDEEIKRLKDYKYALENLAEYGTRRLATSAIFVGFNTIALTGLGTLIAMAQFNAWQTSIEVTAVAIAILPVNWLWVLALVQYRNGLNLRYAFLQGLEAMLFAEGERFVSALHKPKKSGVYGHRHTSLEIALARYFLALYFIAAIIIVSITCIVQYGAAIGHFLQRI